MTLQKFSLIACIGLAISVGVPLTAAPALAQCSTITGPGMSSGGPCPQQRHFNFNAPSGSRSGGSSRSYYGGGGGGRAAAAAGAASAAIGILGMMIDAAQQAEQAKQNSANEAARRRWAYCQGKYHRAHAINEQAKVISANGDPEEAYQTFERALDILGDCGTRTDLAKLRQNLENTRRDYANLTNPSASYKADDASNIPAHIVLYPAALESGARSQCSFAPENSPSWQACMTNRKAEAVMVNDPAVRDACQSIADVVTRNQCVFNHYWAEMLGKDPKQFGDPSNCYWDEHGKPCYPGGRTTADRGATSVKDDHTSLRNELIRMRDEKAAKNNAQGQTAVQRQAIGYLQSLRDAMPPGPDRDKVDQTLNQLRAGDVPETATGGAATSDQNTAAAQNGDATAATSSSPPAAEAPPPKSGNDDAYENYMQSENKSSGGRNTGDLGPPHPGVQGMEMTPLPKGY